MRYALLFVPLIFLAGCETAETSVALRGDQELQQARAYEYSDAKVAPAMERPQMGESDGPVNAMGH
jgi:hypothetical protein